MVLVVVLEVVVVVVVKVLLHVLRNDGFLHLLVPPLLLPDLHT